jgi:hypothetical protein
MMRTESRCTLSLGVPTRPSTATSVSNATPATPVLLVKGVAVLGFDST